MTESTLLRAPLNAAPPETVSVGRLSLRNNFLWTATGNIVFALCQWGMLTTLAKLGSAEWVGQFALGLAMTAPVILLTNLQLRAVQATDAGNEYEFSHYFALRLLMSGIATLVIGGVILLSGLNATTALVVAAVGLSKIIESVSDVFYGLLQKHERMDRVSVSLMLRGALALAAFAVMVYVKRDVVSGVLAMAAMWLAVLVFYDVRSAHRVLARSFRPVWNFRVLRRLAVVAAPLGVVMMLNSLNVNIPRYVLQYLNGTRDVGIYAALAYLLIVEGTIVNALGQSATPRLARLFRYGHNRSYWTLLGKLIGLGSVGGVAGVAVAALAGPVLLALLYRPEYAEYSSAFVWLMIGAIFTNITAFLGYGLTATRAFRVQVPILAGESVVLAAACFILVPRYGIQGAAIAYLVAKIFLAVSRLWLLRRICNNMDANDYQQELVVSAS